jgi:hypothetical protein
MRAGTVLDFQLERNPVPAESSTSGIQWERNPAYMEILGGPAAGLLTYLILWLGTCAAATLFDF